MNDPFLVVLVSMTIAYLLIAAMVARVLGVSVWRVLAFLNVNLGTWVTRGPREGLAEIDAFVDERRRP